MSAVGTQQDANGRVPTAAALLELRGITAGYGGTMVLRDLDLSVPEGSVVALLGPNGAGKTTLLRVAAGLISPRQGEVRLKGEDVTRRRPFQRARSGVCLIPEGRGIFPNLSVRDNLILQVPPWRAPGFDVALDAFPILRERLGQKAGSLSGGQQQMLALSRCFLSHPRLVLLDEVSMGLAPMIIDEIFAALRTLKSMGVSLLLVEQYVSRALHVADHVYLLGRGSVQFSGPAAELDEATIGNFYLGAEHESGHERSA